MQKLLTENETKTIFIAGYQYGKVFLRKRRFTRKIMAENIVNFGGKHLVTFRTSIRPKNMS